MKKTISLILVTVMMCMFCLPLTAFAADNAWAGNQTFTDAQTVATGNTLTVTGTYTVKNKLTVDAGATLTIASGGTLVISENGSLVNNGTVVINNGGTLNLTATGSSATTAALVNTGKFTIKSTAVCVLGSESYAFNTGVMENVEKMVVDGKLNHQVQIPQIGTVSYKYTETWNRERLDVDFQVQYYTYEEGSGDLDYRNESLYSNATSAWIEQGNTAFITIIPEDGEGDWIDTGRMKLIVNGQVLSPMDKTDNGHAVFSIQPTSAVSTAVYSTAYKDIVKIFEVELPNTEGYYVITSNNEIDVATVEFGKVLSFRVVLAPDYDKSEGSYVVYVNGEPQVDRNTIQDGGMEAGTNDFGYYDISTDTKGQITTAGGVQSDITITVMGIAPNDRIETITGIVSFIQEIFAVIKSIFEYFADIFKGLGNIGV